MYTSTMYTHKPIFIKKKKSNTLPSIAVIGIIVISVMLLFKGVSAIKNLISPLITLSQLHVYEKVDREGECNIFVNGFQEEMRVCPTRGEP